MLNQTEAQVGRALIREANSADNHGHQVTVHTTSLAPIKLHCQISLSACGSIAFVPTCTRDGKSDATMVIPIANLSSIEINCDWVFEDDEQLADGQQQRGPQVAS